MVSEPTRQLVWQKMLDIARYHLYYDKLAGRYQTRSWVLRVALLAAALTGGGTLAMVTGIEMPGPVEAVAALGVAVLLAVDSQGGYAYKAAVFDSVQRECERLDDRFNILWVEMQAGRLDEDGALDRYTALADRLASARERTGGTQVSTDDALLKQCTTTADEARRKRYAS